MSDKPRAAFAVSLAGGILILVFAIIWGLVTFDAYTFFGVRGVLWLILGVVFGCLVIGGAVLFYVQPRFRIAGGAMVLTFSILSILTGFGGLIAGLVLGIIGGAMAMAWKGGSATRICMGCGRAIPFEYTVCPHCGRGTQVPGPAFVPMAAAPPVAPAAPAMYCTNCGRPLQAGFVVCPYCGTRLGAAPSAPPPGSSPPPPYSPPGG